MSKIIGILFCLMSFKSIACPTIEGSYKCFGEKPFSMSISMSDMATGGKLYSVSKGNEDLAIIADGKTKFFGKFQEITDSTISSKCSGRQLNVKVTGKVLGRGEALYKAKIQKYKPTKIMIIDELKVGNNTLRKNVTRCEKV
jgi:hypothetical protein